MHRSPAPKVDAAKPTSLRLFTCSDSGGHHGHPGDEAHGHGMAHGHTHGIKSFAISFDDPLDGSKLSFAMELLRAASQLH